MTQRFVEVAVQLPVRGTYHYSVPPSIGEGPFPGARVMAPFGNRGVSGVVVRVIDDAPENISGVKALDRLLDEPPIPEELLALCLWIADYYEAAPGEVIKAALPIGSSVRAKQFVGLTDAGRAALDGGALTRGLRDVLGAVASAGGDILQRQLVSGGVKSAAIVEAEAAGFVRVHRDPGRSRVRGRTLRVASLCHPPSPEELSSLSRAPRQRQVINALVAAGGSADIGALSNTIPRASVHVRSLVRAGLVTVSQRQVRADELSGAADGIAELAGGAPPSLSEHQERALAAICRGLDAGEFRAYLLHGITGSGKTEVYLRAIAEVIESGRTAIVLVPEISLTPQLAARFGARFGDAVAVLHSGLSDRERYDEWHRLQDGAARIAVGARSAIFAPVANPGIIVVDEEHDGSFKQEEGVRYSARDVALVRAKRAGAVCVLGSATPSLESSHAARRGRYELLELKERPTPRPLPDVELIDLRQFAPDRESLLTAPLATAIEETLAAGDQTILFLNRRGFNTFTLCVKCGAPFHCPHCAVTLTYHRFRDVMVCHYCGYSERPVDDCKMCGAQGAVSRRGQGTERVAAAVAERFPGARVARLDRDVGGGAKVARVLSQVARREVDILLGTQMVTKGHDFPGVTLVGVLSADTGLSLPDFRAAERTFQLLTQVAGRAGRGDRPGRVLIQSYRITASPVVAAGAHDYEAFYAAELQCRRELGYPPFGHLMAVRIDGRDGAGVEREARRLADIARRLSSATSESSADHVTALGPCEAPLGRLKGRTRWHLWLRSGSRRALRGVIRGLLATGEPVAGVRVVVDVDPISAL